MNAKNTLRFLLRFGRKHSTKLLAGGAILAEAFSLWFMKKEAPIARDRLVALPEEATLWEKVKTTGPIYIPSMFMFLVSAGCIVGGCAIGEAKFAAMAGIASASEATLRKYEQKMIDTVGKEKAQEIHAEVAKELAKERPLKDSEVEYTSHGGQLFYDKLSSRFFSSSENYIRQAVAKVNNTIYEGLDMWASVNEFYTFLDIKDAKMGDYFGWNTDYPLEVSFYADRTEEGQIYEVIVYYNDPRLYDGNPPKKVHS